MGFDSRGPLVDETSTRLTSKWLSTPRGPPSITKDHYRKVGAAGARVLKWVPKEGPVCPYRAMKAIPPRAGTPAQAILAGTGTSREVVVPVSASYKQIY